MTAMNTADLELFIRVADSGNITSAALELGISPATASAALKRLEQQLDNTLFVRSTRKLRLTDAGERYLPYCRRVIHELSEAQQALNDEKNEISGTLRLSVSSDFGRNLLLPWLDEFLADHPKLQVSLLAGDSLSDFYHDRIDMAVRYGKPEDSSLVAFPICETQRVLCASPDYLNYKGTPQHPRDLADHNCLLYFLGDRAYDQWSFKDHAGETYKINVRGDRICNDADFVHRWAVTGKGIALKSRLDMIHDLNKGRVVTLLDNFQTEAVQLWLVCPSRKQVTPAVILFREMLRKHCQALLNQP